MDREPVVRGAVMDDAERVAHLVNEVELAQVEMAVYTPSSLQEEWSQHGDDLAANTRIVEVGGRLAGYVDMHPDADSRELYYEGYVAPDWADRGIQTLLFEIAEDEAGSLARRLGDPVSLSTNVGNTRVATDLERRGYERTLHELAMFLDLDGHRPEVALPAGVTIRPFVEGRDERLMWDTMRAGFAEDWDGTPDREEWIRVHQEAPAYDPALWFFAWHDDRAIGAVQAGEQWRAQADTGWLKNIAVLEPARRKGVGRALLFHAAGLFNDRGKKRMVLGTYAANPTAAPQFYLHLGMRIGGESFDYANRIAPS